MANQTVTTTVNHDSAAVTGLANGETYTINGGSLTFNCDSRWGQNDAVFGSISISSTLGGTLYIDGTQVWELPFSSSTGNVPSLAALGSNGVTGGTSGATGELFRVWATGSLTPATAAAAMPATGWIKLRTKTGTFQNGEVVTLPGGATITLSGAGKRSWIQITGAEAGTLTLPRLGNFSMVGDWYEIGTTNGADGQTFQFPVADTCPAIQIETSAGSGVYEWWLNGGSRWNHATVTISQDTRGKFFGCNNTTGIITIAQRASNACGYKPATGCKVRIPNIICSSSTATNWALNTINATLATRYDFTTTSGGTVNINNAIVNWFMSAVNATAVNLSNSAFTQQINISNTSTDNTLTNIAVGLYSTGDFAAVVVANCFGNTNLTNSRIGRYSAVSTAFVFSATDTFNINIDTVDITLFGGTATTITRANANTRTIGLTRCFNCTINNAKVIGASVSLTTCSNITITNLQYADISIGTTTVTVPTYVFTLDTGTSNVTIDGLTWYGAIASLNAYSGLLNAATSVSNVTLKNIGTFATPLNLSASNGSAYIAVCTISKNLYFRRIYVSNTRTGPFSLANTVDGVEIIDVRSDYADSSTIASNNTIVKSAAWTYSTTGQTSVYGRHFETAFISATAANLVIACNEPTAETAAQLTTNFTTGSGWTATGSVALVNLNDYVEWEWPHYILGITALTNSAPTLTGTNTANHTLTFQYNTGAGYNGTWLTASAANLATVTGLNSSVGVKLKFRLTCSTASTSNLMKYIKIAATTTSTDQQVQYPLPGIPVTLTGLQTGSEIRVYVGTDPATAVELAGIESSTTSFYFEHNNATQSGYIVIFALGYAPLTIPITFSSSSSTIPIQQVLDRVYVNP